VPYDEMATPRGLLRAITQLQCTGLLFLPDVVWNVNTMDESRNIAYTGLFLGLHMGPPYNNDHSLATIWQVFRVPPRFQILHCLSNRVRGGISLFVDACPVPIHQ
jgi:gamma-butyrobetaine dioxygenase